MGQPTPISLGIRSNPARQSKQAGNARLINCFAEEVGEEGKSQWIITAIAGLSAFATLSGADGGIRDMLEVDGTLYVVAGRQVYQVLPSGTATLIGGIPTDGPVYMRRNRRVPTQIGIVSDGLYYVIENNVMTEVQDPDLPPPTSLAYLDGFGILPISRGRYMITAIDDFTAIDGLDEGVAESNPDPIVRAHELEREVYLFGTQSTEAHQNTGNADFPLERSQTMEVGCAAADSVCAVDTPNGKALMFVAHDHTVKLLRGYQTVTVSTKKIADLIRQLVEAGRVSELRATAWSWGGISFYQLSCEDWTQTYSEGRWHDRKSHLSERTRISKVIPFGNKLVAGDATTGSLYQVKDEFYDEAGNPLMLEIIPPPVHAFPYRGTVNALFIDAVSGVGLNTAVPQDLDPVMLVDWSKDGGETWSAPREVALHRLGQNARRIKPERRIGKFGHKGITFRFRISAAVQKVVMSIALDFDTLAA